MLPASTEKGVGGIRIRSTGERAQEDWEGALVSLMGLGGKQRPGADSGEHLKRLLDSFPLEDAT